MVHYRDHKSPPQIPIPSHINPIHTVPSYHSKIHFILSTYPRLGLPSGLFPFRFLTNILCAFLFSRIHATFPTNSILLDLIIQIILGEEYKLLNSSLCRIFQPPVTSFLFDQIFLNILFSNTFSPRSSLNIREQVSNTFRTKGKLIFCIF
jgi:hypothetical protein